MLKILFHGFDERRATQSCPGVECYRIRPSANLESLSEKPDILYSLPEQKGAQDYSTLIDVDKIEGSGRNDNGRRAIRHAHYHRQGLPTILCPFGPY